jgi:LysM repeat protein
MPGNENPQSVIDSYKKRQQIMPFLIGGLAGISILGGIVLLVYWLSGPNKPGLAMFASKTSSPTFTFTPSPITPTSTITLSPTLEPSLSPAASATPSGPFEYTVVDGDYCGKIAAQFSTEVRALVLLNPTLGAQCNIKVGQKILIPLPGAILPSDTPIPPNIRAGTIIEYTINPGDTIGKIAQKFNSIAETIMTNNKITDPNLIFVGQVIKIPVNIITVVPTRVFTITPGGTQIGGTKAAVKTATPTVAPTK